MKTAAKHWLMYAALPHDIYTFARTDKLRYLQTPGIMVRVNNKHNNVAQSCEGGGRHLS